MNVTIQALTAANYKLYQFADEKDTYGSQLISALKNYKWDYVILQDHREMIITDIAKTQTAIETLKPLIQSSGAKMLLYDTQADYIGRSFTATGYSYYLSHNEIQHYMIKGYYMMGNKYGAQVISSGVNFLYPPSRITEELAILGNISSVVPTSLNVVGIPNSFINSESFSIPARAISSLVRFLLQLSIFFQQILQIYLNHICKYIYSKG